MQRLVELCLHKNYEVRKYAYWALSNAAANGAAFCEVLCGLPFLKAALRQEASTSKQTLQHHVDSEARWAVCNFLSECSQAAFTPCVKQKLHTTALGERVRVKHAEQARIHATFD